MSLTDSDFEDREDLDLYQIGEKYRKMVKMEGWGELRKDMEITIKNKVEELANCDIKKIEHIRGVVAGYREILNKVDSAISEALEIEREIKKIPQEDDNE